MRVRLSGLMALLALAAAPGAAAAGALVLEGSQTRTANFRYSAVADNRNFASPDARFASIWFGVEGDRVLDFAAFDRTSGVLVDADMQIDVRIRDLVLTGIGGGAGFSRVDGGYLSLRFRANDRLFGLAEYGLPAAFCRTAGPVCINGYDYRLERQLAYDVTAQFGRPDYSGFQLDFGNRGAEAFFFSGAGPRPNFVATRDFSLDLSFTLNWRYNPVVGDPLPPPAVPEPATWMMMIAGFGIVGFATRRRQTALTA